MKYCLRSSLLTLGLFFASALNAEETDVREAQLFLDDGVIESSTLVERIIHQPVRSPDNPLLAAEEPWEGPTINYLGGVYKDPKSGLFRAWYVGVVSGGIPELPKIVYPICTVFSEDGIHWHRPKLEIYSHLTGGPNNIVLHLDKGCAGAPQILYDEHDAARPWKLIIHHSPETPCHYYVRLASSPDGIHWRWEQEIADIPYAKLHDRLTALIEPSNPEYPYVLLGRPAQSKLYPLLYPGRIRTREVYTTRLSADGSAILEDPVLALRPDVEDPTDVEFYHMSAYRYESLYIGTIMIYKVADPPHSEVQLATSRDLQHWERVRPRRPFMAPSLEKGRATGEYDSHGIQPALSPPIRHEDALWFYFYAGQAFHASRFLGGDYRLGVAKLRLDGFASLRARWREGVVTTKAFLWPGGKLTVNSSTHGGMPWESWVKVTILDEAGTPLPDFDYENAKNLGRESYAEEPRWSDEPQNLDALKGKRIRLRFFLRQAEVFAFQSRE